MKNFFTNLIDFCYYLKHCYYRGYYICHRNDFVKVIYELEGINIDDVSYVLEGFNNEK